MYRKGPGKVMREIFGFRRLNLMWYGTTINYILISLKSQILFCRYPSDVNTLLAEHPFLKIDFLKDFLMVGRSLIEIFQ